MLLRLQPPTPNSLFLLIDSFYSREFAKKGDRRAGRSVGPKARTTYKWTGSKKQRSLLVAHVIRSPRTLLHPISGPNTSRLNFRSFHPNSWPFRPTFVSNLVELRLIDVYINSFIVSHTKFHSQLDILRNSRNNISGRLVICNHKVASCVFSERNAQSLCVFPDY